LRDLADSGIAMVVVEHLMGFIGEVTDRVIVLNAGREIFEGKLGDAVRDRQVVEVFLGVGDAV
jgi:branched-chain amino acid transport system ATP-binding protein